MKTSSRLQMRVWGVIGLAALLLSGCAGRSLDKLQNARPVFQPEEYFAGHTHSWGVFESRSGAPTKIIRTQTAGQRDGGTLRFEQDIQIEGNKDSHRSWLIRRADSQHYTATGTGIVGTARGEISGNALHLQFTLEVVSGNPLTRVHMSQWMYLQEDGVTMINRAIATKGGVILTEVTEQFRKDR